MNGHDCTNNTRRNPSDCQVYTSVQALMAESVTKRLGPVHDNHWPVAGNGRLITGHRSISDRSYRMVSFGYVSPDLATSGLYWSTTCKFMVMFLQFAQRQKHCCLCWHQSLISCRCGCGSGSQLYLSPPVPSRRLESSPFVTAWMSSMLLYPCNWPWPSQCFTFRKRLLMKLTFWCFKYCTCWYDMAVCMGGSRSLVCCFGLLSWFQAPDFLALLKLGWWLSQLYSPKL